MNPIEPDLEVQRQAWDEWIERHMPARREPDAINRLRMSIACEAVRSVGGQPARILEIGCGSGDLCHALSAYGEVTGIDLAPRAIAEAQARYPRIHFIAGDFLQMELPVGRFDAVVSNSVLAHVPDQAAFCARASELLRADGLFVVLTQNRFVYERRDDNIMPAGVLRHWVGARELRRLLKPHFAHVRIRTYVPSGNLGALRWVNAAKLNRPLNALLGADRVRRFKERLGFGQELVAVARAKQG